MPTLQVREVPAAVYAALTGAAKQEHRSLAQQTLVTLERGLGLAEDSRRRRQQVIARIAATPVPGAKGCPDPVPMLREDRGR